MKLKLAFLILMISSIIGSSQNLIPNGDFELYTGSFTGPSQTQMNICNGWHNPLSTSPDYISNNGVYALTPFAASFAVETPRSGDGMLGFGGIGDAVNSTIEYIYREAISTELISSMEIGKSYILTFYLSHGTSKWKEAGTGCRSLSIFFTTNKLENISPKESLKFNPQIVSTEVLWYEGWTKMQYKIIADSSYKFMTVGYFNPNDEIFCIEKQVGSSTQSNYQFVDDFELVKSTNQELAATGDSLICLGDTATITAYNANSYRWATIDEPNTIIAVGSPLKIAPQKNTRYLIYGPTDTAYFDVTIKNPVINFPDDTTLCEYNYLSLNVDQPYTKFLWQDGSTGGTFLGKNNGKYWVQATHDGCTSSDTIDVKFITPPSITVTVNDINCTNKEATLAVQNNSYNLLWNTGDTMEVITVQDSGFYWVKDYEDDCLDSAGVQVSFDTCTVSTEIISTNIFSPNNDGVNDHFEFKVSGSVTSFNLEIYNRWGLKVYQNSQVMSWDGTDYQSFKRLGSGTYFWTLQYEEPDGTIKIKNGFVSLIR